ncbi:MAG: ABC transporter substrate-binding protein [Candidatus Methylomirabilales bacterium]
MTGNYTLAATLAAVLAIGSLGGPAAAATRESVRVGYVHVFDDAPVVVARDKGFFTAQGLEAEVTAFTSGPTLVKGLVTGQLDVGVLGFTNAITWAAQGADLKIIGKVQDGYHALVARSDRGISSLGDLKHRTVATQAVGSTADIVLKGVVLRKAGLREQDVQFVYTSPATALASLRAGRVDAAFLFEPYDSMVRASLPVIELDEVGKSWPFPCMVVIVPGRLIAERPGVAKAVLQSLKQSVGFMTTNPAEASRVLAPAFMAEGGHKMETGAIPAEEIMRRSLTTQKFDWRLGAADLKRMAELSGIMKELGVLKRDVPLETVLDLRWQREIELASK